MKKKLTLLVVLLLTLIGCAAIEATNYQRIRFRWSTEDDCICPPKE